MDQAEQLRNIIKKQTRHHHLARVITVTSGKGGVGKSNISLNLAIQLSKLGKKVVIFDADFGLANIEVMLGIRPGYNLSDVIFKGKRRNYIKSFKITKTKMLIFKLYLLDHSWSFFMEVDR